MPQNDTVLAVLILVVFAYLLGTFPSAELVARHYGIDVTKSGSGNPGTSNVVRLVGWKAGALVLIADVAKGGIAAGVGLAIDGHRGAFILGVAAVLGHVFPVWSRFKGGRGVATGAGVFLVVFPLITVGLAVVWIAIPRAAQGVGRVTRVRGRGTDPRGHLRWHHARHRGRRVRRAVADRTPRVESAPLGARRGARVGRPATRRAARPSRRYGVCGLTLKVACSFG